MKKGIIVLDDIPVICADCYLSSFTKNHKYLYCNVKDEIVYNAKPHWCPIKNFPNRKPLSSLKLSPMTEEHYNSYNKGWNDCVDELERITKWK